MSTWNLDNLLDPGSIAVVGASDRTDSPGNRLARNLLDSGFPGQLFFVNPRYQRVCGEPCYRALRHLPTSPELVLFIGPERVARRNLVQCGRTGVKVAILMSVVRNAKNLHRLARQLDVRLLGPRSAGLIRPYCKLNASLSSNHIAPGRLAIVSQSASLGAAIIDWAETTGVGFSALISTGDEIDIRLADLLDLLAEDVHTRAIIVYLDRIHGVRGFLSAISAAARSKPVVLMKSTGHTAPFTDALLRTGHEYSSDAVLDAALNRAGVVRIRSFSNLFAAARILARGTRVSGKRLAIIANGAAPAMLACARLTMRNHQLQPFDSTLLRRLEQRVGQPLTGRNPLVLRHGNALAGAYRAAIEQLRDSGEFDALLVLHAPDARHDPLDVAEATIDCLPSSVPILSSWMGEASVGKSRKRLTAANLPSFRTPEAAVDGFHVLYRYHVNQLQLLQLPGPAAPELDADLQAANALLCAALDEGRRMLDDGQSRRLLRCFALDLHASGEGIKHQSADDVRVLKIALYRDALFGPVIALGAGGALAALLPERVLQLPPLNRFLIEQMLDAPEIAALLGRFDHCPPVDRGRLAEILRRVSALASELPDLNALHIDGLHIAGEHAVASTVAAVVEADRHTRRHAHLAIQPYPADWTTCIELADGRTVTLRPIRPEDASAVQAMVRNLSPQSRYFRFMHTLNELSPRLTAALTKLDYDRQMAFVAVGPEEEIVGVSRYAQHADARGAEFAVTVADDWTGRGLARQLLGHLATYACQAGVEWLEGTVLQDNDAMHALMRSLGAHVEATDNSEPVIAYRLRLDTWQQPWQAARQAASESTGSTARPPNA